MDTVEPLVFSVAVRDFWRIRQQQSDEQRQRGSLDQGLRGTATGGQQMRGFIETVIALLIGVGVPPANIYVQRTATGLPGFYRPSKDWDLVVLGDGQLLAALEFKSQTGPSFGNNFNNRTEEAMGSALDLWTAYREGAFGTAPPPWLGYLFLLEDSAQSQRPVAVRPTHFPVLAEFAETSYARRYELFCRKLVRERQYNAACFLTAARDQADLQQNYQEPAQDLAAAQFLSQLLRHVRPAAPLT